MILIVSLLLRPWFDRVTEAPLAERVHRTETFFWLCVTCVLLALVTALVLQATLPLPSPPSGRPSVQDRA